MGKNHSSVVVLRTSPKFWWMLPMCVRGNHTKDESKTQQWRPVAVKPVRTPVAILGSLGVCIYVPASRHWLISYSPIHLN